MNSTLDLLKTLLSALPEEEREAFARKIKATVEQQMSPAEIILMHAAMSAAAFRILSILSEDDARHKPMIGIMGSSLSDLGEFLEKHDSTRDKFQTLIPSLLEGAARWVQENKP